MWTPHRDFMLHTTSDAMDSCSNLWSARFDNHADDRHHVKSFATGLAIACSKIARQFARFPQATIPNGISDAIEDIRYFGTPDTTHDIRESELHGLHDSLQFVYDKIALVETY